jgi:hypothetical protein
MQETPKPEFEILHWSLATSVYVSSPRPRTAVSIQTAIADDIAARFLTSAFFVLTVEMGYLFFRFYPSNELGWSFRILPVYLQGGS